MLRRVRHFEAASRLFRKQLLPGMRAHAGALPVSATGRAEDAGGYPAGRMRRHARGEGAMSTAAINAGKPRLGVIDRGRVPEEQGAMGSMRADALFFRAQTLA